MIWLLGLLIATIPIGTRFLIATVIPGFHEYEAIFIYASDVVLLFALGWGFLRHRGAIHARLRGHEAPLLFILLIAGIAAAFAAPSHWLSLYVLLRLIALMAFAYVVGEFASSQKVIRAIFAVIAIVAVLESLIGLTQFGLQGSLGLERFGESQLLTTAGSTSTISAEGGRLLRIYGTFPHPNVLAAFLVLGIIALSYWYLRFEERIWSSLALKVNHSWRSWTTRDYAAALNRYVQHKHFYLRLLVAAMMFVVVLALGLTFSRAGWIAGAFGLVALAAASVRHRPGGAVRLLLMVGACAGTVVLLFASAIGPRAQLVAGEPAVDMRFTYMKIGAEMLTTNIGGVGPGNQVLYAVGSGLYKEAGLTKAWDFEPIHSLYFLVGVELGWLGLLSFLGFLGIVTWQLVRQPRTLELVCVLALLCAVYTLALFDHYFWDLEQGRLMLWLVIGLALSQLPATLKKA